LPIFDDATGEAQGPFEISKSAVSDIPIQPLDRMLHRDKKDIACLRYSDSSRVQRGSK
jgi:hypothetical protein